MPISISGTNGITLSGQFDSASSFGFKNRIINGAMVIDQRNAGASVTPTSGQYMTDRWTAYLAQPSKFTAQQNQGAVTPPAGYSNYLGYTSSSAYSIGATESFFLYQAIEANNIYDLNFGTANASSVTVSFWVRSSLTGTFGGALANYAQTRTYPFSFTINSANTWEQKSVTIAGDTGGTWVSSGNAGAMYLWFSLGSGSSRVGTAGAWTTSNVTGVTGQQNVIGTNGATFYITGVQLEKGSTATSFDYRPYGTELALCQRYYQRFNAGGASNISFATGSFYNTTSMYIEYPLKVTMRSAPTGSASATNALIAFANSNSFATSAITVQGASTDYVEIVSTVTGATAGYGCFVRFNATTAWIDFSAEL